MTNPNLLPLPNEDPETVSDLVHLMIRDQRIRTEVTRGSHMWFFLTYLADYVRYPFAPFHREMFALSEDDTLPMLVLMAFRGSAKSTIFTLSYPIWAILGQQKKKFIVILGQTQQQARQYLANLKRELERNDLLRRDLGPFEERDEEWSAGSIVIPKYDARITAISCEQGIRGLRHGAYRPDLIICDDLENLDSVRTRDGRQKLYQWLMGEVIPAGDVNTRIVIVGNCLHDDGIMMRLQREITAGARLGVFRSFPLLDDEGICLWPGKFPDPELVESFKRSVVDEITWQREYLLRIIAGVDTVIHRDWIQYYDEAEMAACGEKFRYVGIGIDLAISDKDTADYTAMVTAHVYGRIKKLRIFIQPHPTNERLGFPDTYERVKAMANLHTDKAKLKIFIEDVGYQGALIQMLEKDGYPAEGVKLHGADKRSRLALTSHLIKNGVIRFPRIGAEELIEQLTGFGSERHDDLADAFSSLIIKIKEHDKPAPCIGFISFGWDGSVRDTRIELD
ncbi:MAG: hypothetical protein AAB413_01760 [Patescibacteria group bacterium]